MRVLLDTHVLIWAVSTPERVASEIEDLSMRLGAEIYVSAASIWEIAIKFALGRPDFTLDPHRAIELAVDAGFYELPVTSRAAALVATLPLHHRDPFDRLLVAQAIDEGAHLLTADTALAAYAPHILTLGAAPGRAT